MHAARPVSFYLLLTIPVALLLGARMGQVRDQPKQFALYLILLFVYFGVVLIRAVIDLFEIGKRHFYERERLYGSTLGEPEFLDKLRDRTSEESDD